MQLVLLFVLLVPAAAVTHRTDYANEKVLRLFTLTLLAATVPFIIIRYERDAECLWRWLALLGGVMTVDGLVTLCTSPNLARLQVFSGSTIGLGRGVGVLLVWVVCRWAGRHMNGITATALVVGLSAVMLASGSRGPMLAGIVTALTIIVASGNVGLRAGVRLTCVVAAVGATVVATYHFLPAQSVARTQAVLKGDEDESSECRVRAYSASLAKMVDSPWGVGIGAYPEQVVVVCANEVLRYPHNIALEIGVECGVCVCAYFMWLLGRAGRDALRHIKTSVAQKRPTHVALSTGGVLMFMAICTMFSGDINDNRMLFAVLAVPLSVGVVHRRPSRSRIGSPRPRHASRSGVI